MVYCKMEPEVWKLFIYSPLIKPFVQYMPISIYHVSGTLKSKKQTTFILIFRELKM